MSTTFKDLFSRQATDYARFRPTYPWTLFAWLAEQAPARALALDVATGNGQAAVGLSPHFERVIAVDPSEAQLGNATRGANIDYRCAPAEATGLGDGTVDLLAVAQAFHWFKPEAFFHEARRVIRPGGVLAIWCYAHLVITPEVDSVIHELYETYLGPYWDPARRLVETGYRDVAVPFTELAAPPFEMRFPWSFAQLAGYLGTWSPRPRYLTEHGQDAVEIVFPRLEQAWGTVAERQVTWPLSVRAFRL